MSTRTVYARLVRANPKVRWGPLRSVRPRGALLPADAEYGMTADHVIDEPRQPRMIATGILDEHGEMLVRVVIPIRLSRIGFHIPNLSEAVDEVVAIVPESMLHIVEDCPGEGIGHVDPSEVDYVSGDEAEDVFEIIPSARRRK